MRQQHLPRATAGGSSCLAVCNKHHARTSCIQDLHIVSLLGTPDLRVRRRQDPLKSEAPLLLEVYDAIIAGIDPAALLNALPPDAASVPARERRAGHAQPGGCKDIKAELDNQERAFQALRNVRPTQALSCMHDTDAAVLNSDLQASELLPQNSTHRHTGLLCKWRCKQPHS